MSKTREDATKDYLRFPHGMRQIHGAITSARKKAHMDGQEVGEKRERERFIERLLNLGKLHNFSMPAEEWAKLLMKTPFLLLFLLGCAAPSKAQCAHPPTGTYADFHLRANMAAELYQQGFRQVGIENTPSVCTCVAGDKKKVYEVPGLRRIGN